MEAKMIPMSKNKTHKNPALPLFGPSYLLIALQKMLLVLYPLTIPANAKSTHFKPLF